MSSTLDEKIRALAGAQHRRLLALNEEIRKARRSASPHERKVMLAILMARRKQADQAYSGILKVELEPRQDLKKLRYDMALTEYNKG